MTTLETCIEVKAKGRGMKKKKKKSFLRRPWLNLLWNTTPQEMASHTHEGAAEKPKGRTHRYSLSLSPSESSELEEPKSPKVTCIGQVRVSERSRNIVGMDKKTILKDKKKKKKRVKKNKRRDSSCYFLSFFHSSRHPLPEPARSAPESGTHASIFARFLLLLAQIGRRHHNPGPQEAPLQQSLETKPRFLKGLTEETETRLYWESSLSCRTLGEGFNKNNSSSDLVSILRRSHSAPAGGGRRVGLFFAAGKDAKGNAFIRRCKSYSFVLSLEEEEEKEQRGEMDDCNLSSELFR